MKIGILGTADIAFRRFLPALQGCPDVVYAGVASRTIENANRFIAAFGGQAYPSYDALLSDSSIDAVYVPLPPALHYEWGRKVLESGKHLLMEKPFTVSLAETGSLLDLAKKKGLTVHENYMFLYHSQLESVKGIIADGTLGDLRLIRTAFGFPKRAGDDFRYNKKLGGGALLDCGGYPVRLALELLGETVCVKQARLCKPAGYEVDLFGSAVLENKDGLCAQVSFGMDNSYKCELEIWGSRASLAASRIFTAGPDVKPGLTLQFAAGEQKLELSQDDQFSHSIQEFLRNADRVGNHDEKIRKQSALINRIQKEGF